MEFRYFQQPEKFTGLQENISTCDFCAQEKPCFDGSTFYGEDQVNAICPDCLAHGALKDMDVVTCNGDIGSLRKQLRKLYPSLNAEEIERQVIDKTAELEKMTPPLITWQDWEWPCLDGDYARFSGYGSQPFYKRLAGSASGMALFKASIVDGLDEEVDKDELWDDALSTSEIKDYSDSSEMDTLFYVFRSLTSDKIVTIMDGS